MLASLKVQHHKKLIRKLLTISPHRLPKSLVLSLVAIINCSSKTDAESNNDKRHQQPVARDRLYRACIEIICEISFVTPLIVIHVGGFRALLGTWMSDQLDFFALKKSENFKKLPF